MLAYSGKAQPYLDAIAESIFKSKDVRDWLIAGTPVEADYIRSDVLIDEQRAVRWRTKPTKQPFWANYWCGLDSRCTCRIEGSKGLESDAIFFFRNHLNRILAVHIEFKHPNESFRFGQPEAYPLRAACFAKTFQTRPTLNSHHDWTTVLFCGSESLSDKRLSHFQRVITHRETAAMITTYPREWGIAPCGTQQERIDFVHSLFKALPQSWPRRLIRAGRGGDRLPDEAAERGLE